MGTCTLSSPKSGNVFSHNSIISVDSMLVPGTGDVAGQSEPALSWLMLFFWLCACEIGHFMVQELAFHPLQFQVFFLKKRTLHSMCAQCVAEPGRLISETDCVCVIANFPHQQQEEKVPESLLPPLTVFEVTFTFIHVSLVKESHVTSPNCTGSNVTTLIREGKQLEMCVSQVSPESSFKMILSLFIY